jgi:hypothetical protein
VAGRAGIVKLTGTTYFSLRAKRFGD